MPRRLRLVSITKSVERHGRFGSRLWSCSVEATVKAETGQQFCWHEQQEGFRDPGAAYAAAGQIAQQIDDRWAADAPPSPPLDCPRKSMVD